MFNRFSLTVVQNASKWHLIETEGGHLPKPQHDPEPEIDPELPLEETLNNEYSENSEDRVMVSYDYDFDSENKASKRRKKKRKPSKKRKKKTKKQKRGCKGRCRKKGKQNKVMVEYSGFVDDRNPWIKKVCGC